MTPLPSLNAWLHRNPVGLDAVFLDIDGVLLSGGQRLSGSRTLLGLLVQHKLAYVLLTNDGNHSIQEKAARFERAGLPVAHHRIVSCGHAIAPLVTEREIAGQLFFIMGDTGHPCYAQTAGLQTTRDPQKLESCQGVIIGEEHYDWEPIINAVVNFFIDRPQALLIVPNPDEFYPGEELHICIAAGGVTRFIQQVLKTYGREIKPIYLGKPYVPIFRMAHRRLEQQSGCTISPERLLMVGDNLSADIDGGIRMGYRTALILTGVTTLSALKSAAIRPDLVFKAL